MSREQTHRTADLNYLSRQADAEARARGEKTPAEWSQFGHFPMAMSDGTPVFDGTRMRPDQIEDAIEELEKYLKLKARAADAFTLVDAYMGAYGKSGVRVQDVVEETRVSDRQVRRALATMVEQAKIVMKTEKTRGSGSRRQRYYLADGLQSPTYNSSELGAAVNEQEGMWLESGQEPEADTGVRYHGTGVQGVTCGCGSCTYAFEEAVAAELRSKARKEGDRKAAFAAGLEIRAMRRERENAEFAAMLPKALLS